MSIIAEPIQNLAPIIEPIRQSAKLPSMAAAVVIGDHVVGTGATGVRKLHDPTEVTVDDKYHLGSCTKPITATLTAILIDQGKLEWDTTIGDVLDRKVSKIHDDYREVTIEQLLVHMGGFATAAPIFAWKAAWRRQGKEAPADQRRAYVKDLLKARPSYKPGTKTVYSNQGYAVAGHMLETLMKKPWEELVREYIFVPLEMGSAGFRTPCSKDVLDQPWGHAKGKPVAPEPKGDNPDAIGPAGTVHASIEDWAKFARFHLQRETGSLIKREATFDRLIKTLPTSGRHGVGGWLVHDLDRLGGQCMQMTGSNTMWYALLWILPGYDAAIVVTTNSAQRNAFESCDKVVVALLKHYELR